ncbi:hypothetical protein MTO96_034028 [Rhipicephalus appendiculatus]
MADTVIAFTNLSALSCWIAVCHPPSWNNFTLSSLDSGAWTDGWKGVLVYCSGSPPDRKDGFQRGSVTCERNIQLSFLSFGASLGLTSFAQCMSICPGASSCLGYKLVCVFKHDVRVIWIFLTLQHARQCTNPDSTYKLEIPYENILRAVVDDREGNAATTDVYLHLSTFPLIYKKSEKTASQKQEEPSETANTSNARNPEHFSYERAIEIGCFCTSVIPSSKLGTNFVLVLGLRRLSRRCDIGTIFAYTSVSVHEVGPEMEVMPTSRPSWCFSHNTAYWKGFSKTLREFASHNQALLEPALFAVSADIEARHIVTIPEAVEKAFRKMSQSFVPQAAPPGSCLENRVLRKFLPEFALRVTIRDDNLRPLSHSLAFHQHRNEIVEAIVGRVLRRGIYIGRRQFKLLAASCSQLRDHGVWLFATVTRGQCPEGIREWMGDFSKITSIAKKMARMGQCFSSTEESVQVPLGVGAVTEADKVGGCHPTSKNPYVFSDGIGMVSRSLLQKVCQKLGIEDEPSGHTDTLRGLQGHVVP